jgi:hypothetical protein
MDSQKDMPRVKYTVDITTFAFSAAVFQTCVGWKMSQKCSVPASRPMSSKILSIYDLVNNRKTTGAANQRARQETNCTDRREIGRYSC